MPVGSGVELSCEVELSFSHISHEEMWRNFKHQHFSCEMRTTTNISSVVGYSDRFRVFLVPRLAW